MAQTLDVVGEWWSLLVLRNVFFGQRRFEAIQADLGIARNILSDRLSTLVDHGILSRVKYQDTPERFEYHLTDKGQDLFPVLMALMNWGDKWMSPEGPPLVMTHRDCDHAMTPLTTCSHCGGEVNRRNVKAKAGPGFVRPRPVATS
jgi:DNA-binding HxlR family transcriptional regulator